ncbi:hypothetical protein [Novipirellula artificiosorum]|uniref:Uncharacterized protein n=1 Tax=Novipirellula artificiosorum TaxID=2528016 RepID=A0A5C6DAG8_9BACT|nr:hypothetical protein [Novipirellula artificiosorum]TWU33882.1 hypothetical protein Poly41_48820 [Novipirellula artificiosorum]
MIKPKDRTHWTVTLRPEAWVGDDDAVLRSMRRFLKAALRSYGLRCVDVSQIAPEQAEGLTRDPRRPDGSMRLTDTMEDYRCGD